VRAGGHGWTGSALADGGLTLDIAALRGVVVDPRAAVADLQGGATSGDVAEAAHRHGLVAVTGTVGAVGMAGLSLGGGYGPLSGRFGLAVDNIVAVDIVLADGSLRTADAESERELFWALRGGGGNFGVVTAMRVALHQVPSLLAGMFMYPSGQAERVLEVLGPELLHGPDELTTQTGFIIGPTGEPVLFVVPTWCGEPADGEQAFQQLVPHQARFAPSVWRPRPAG
jgi:FAD/FMN-containing dehydrogenase